MPVPFPGSYYTLCRIADQGVSLGEDAVCPRSTCGARGKLVFTSTWVDRGIIWDQGQIKLVHQVIEIPLAECQGCGGRFRVLPQEILPFKHFSLPIIETSCRLSFEDNRGPIQAAALMEGNLPPHWTTVYHWQSDLGERVLRQVPCPGTIQVPAAALVAESAKRLDPGLTKQWQQPVKVLAHPLRSRRRQEQLETCLRLLLAAAFLFRNAVHPLTSWSAWLTGRFHVFAWSFPSRAPGMTFQNRDSTRGLVRSPEEGKSPGEEHYHDPRSPPHSRLEV